MKKPSVWYWVICVLGVLWGCGGAFDYIMTASENEEYLSQLTPEAMAYFMNMPSWLMWPYAIAVWGGLLGWLLMLFCSRFAIPAFIISLVAMLITFGYWAMTGGFAVVGTAGTVMTVLVIAFAVFAIWFSRRSRTKGYLR